jgi:hypothetical protein
MIAFISSSTASSPAGEGNQREMELYESYTTYKLTIGIDSTEQVLMKAHSIEGLRNLVPC